MEDFNLTQKSLDFLLFQVRIATLILLRWIVMELSSLGGTLCLSGDCTTQA